MNIEVVPALDTESCLDASMSPMKERGDSSTMISDNRKRIWEVEHESPITLQHGTKKGSKNIYFTRESGRSSTHMQPLTMEEFGTVGQKLQESNVCGVEEQLSH